MQAETQQYGVTSYRWVIIGIFLFGAICLGIAGFGVAPLVSSLAEDWGVSYSQANLALVVLLGLFSAIIAFPAGLAVDKFGWKLIVCVGNTVIAIGALLRAATQAWPVFLLANSLVGIGFGFTIATIGGMVLKWFPRREFGLANAVAGVGVSLGLAIANALIFPMLNALGWSGLFLVLGILASIAATSAWIFFREQPPYPPEPVPPLVKAGVWESVKQVMNLDNIILLGLSITLLGYLGIVPAIFPVQLSSYGIPLPTVGLILSVLSIAGIVFSFLVPNWSFRVGRPKLFLVVGTVIMLIAFLAVFFIHLGPQLLWLAFLIAIVLGGPMMGLMPIRIGLSQVQPGVRPWNAGVLTGIIMATNQFGFFILPIISGILVDRSGPLASAIMLAVVTVVSWILLVLFVKEPELKAPTGE